MVKAFLKFLKRSPSLLITTHDPADADGLGAETVLYLIAKTMGKPVRIINSGPIPQNFRFIDSENKIEVWTDVKEAIDREAALIIVDTTDEYNIGEMRDILPYVPEIFVIDHHEPNPFCSFKGCIDSTAASACELVLELAAAAGVKLSPACADAAYAGIVYDTGFFAYPKTSERTFTAALNLVKAGVKPYEIYSKLNENASTAALILQKNVLSTLEIHNQNRVAVQVLRKEDLELTGAYFEDAENFVNTPLKSKEIEVSILVKQTKEGQTRCSLRSKGKVNVSKIAQGMGGGGHVSAAGFRSAKGLDETLRLVLSKITQALGPAADEKP